MNYFRYKIMEPSGQVTSGILQLPYDNEISAITHLERSGNTIIYVRKLNKFVSAAVPFVFQSGRLNKLNRMALAEFINNMAVMLKAGVPLVTALREGASGVEKSGFDSVISSIITDIEAGSTFSDAAAKYPKVFPKTVLQLIRIGEETGRLEEMLFDASEHLRRLQHIVSDTKQALIYPAFVMATMGSGMVFWFYYVVPQILSLFDEMDVELPPLTKVILWISEFLQQNFFVLLAVTLTFIFLVAGSVKHNRRAKKSFEKLLFHIPLCKTVMTSANLAFITEYFSLLLNAGIDVVRSLSILRDTINNEVYREKLQIIQTELTRGESVATSFKSVGLFPSFVVRMINIGEQSGSLPDQLKYIADDYRNRLSTLVANIGKIIEPIVLIFAGIMFAVILGGLFLPIYDLVSQVGAQ